MFEQFLSDEKIIECLNSQYEIKVKSLTFLLIGLDAHASVYKAEALDQTYFVKLKHGHHHGLSISIIHLLHEAGLQEIIPPIKTKNSEPTHFLEDYTLIVYPFVDGPDGFNTHLTDEQWIKLGRALKQVHEVTIPPSIQELLRKETFTPPWPKTVRSLELDTHSLSDPTALKFIEFMKNHHETIEKLVHQTEKLLPIAQNSTAPFVLCHSDIHGDNVLLSGKNKIYIVDWDEPILAPKERDLMFIGGGVGNVWNNPQEEKLFYQGYGKVSINQPLLAYYRHVRILEEIALFAEDLLVNPTKPDVKPILYDIVAAMFQPRGVIDIAFQSLT